MDCKVAAVTVKLADAVLPPNVAEITELPADVLLARPAELIFAVAVEDEVQLSATIVCIVPSE